MRELLSIFLIAIISCNEPTTAVNDPNDIKADITLICNFDSVYHTISENLIGFGLPYSMCSDIFWEKTEIKTALRNMKTGFLRFPDGEITSYYHWNNLNGQGYMDNWNPNYNKKNDQDPKNYTDIDEYIRICRKTGVKPLVGINMESGIKYNRVNDGIEEAKALVKYCMDNNYGVEHFFLDNEPYHSDSHVQMTVNEYIEQIKLYAPELRKINPEIKLIVNWDSNLHDNRFWKLLEQTHDIIDYVDIHWYWDWGKVTFTKWYHTRPMTADNQWYKPGRTYKEEIDYFNNEAKKRGIENVKLISLEWNVGPSENIDLSPNEFQCALIQSEMLMQFMDGGMDMATMWTMLWITKSETPKFSNRYLMNYNDNYRLLPCYDMFVLLSQALNKVKCEVSSSTNAIYPLAVKAPYNSEKIIYLLHKGVFEVHTEIMAPESKNFKLEVFSAEKNNTAEGNVKQVDCIFNKDTKKYHFILPGLSLAKLTIID